MWIEYSVNTEYHTLRENWILDTYFFRLSVYWLEYWIPKNHTRWIVHWILNTTNMDLANFELNTEYRKISGDWIPNWILSIKISSDLNAVLNTFRVFSIHFSNHRIQQNFTARYSYQKSKIKIGPSKTYTLGIPTLFFSNQRKNPLYQVRYRIEL